MKTKLLFLLIVLLGLTSYAQIEFSKGYYIDNNGQKIDCLIKNIDWKNNPESFACRLSEDAKVKEMNIHEVEEFGIYHESKYVRKTVNIDRSSDVIANLSKDRNPMLKEEELFLKVLVEGKADLYMYVENNLKRYFYRKDDSKIEQLIYKRFLINGYKIGKNNRYKQQLWNNFQCDAVTKRIETINYNKKDLSKFFIAYNECANAEIVYQEVTPKRDLINISIRPRLNSSSLTIKNQQSNLINEEIKFDNKIGAALGVELEYVFPFNKNKLGLTLEPTYQYFKGDNTIKTDQLVGGEFNINVDYKSIEMPLGIRYYFFLNKQSKLFINLVYEFDFSLSSSVEITRKNGTTFSNLDIGSQKNFAFGAGYKFMNKFSAEIRYHINRDILADYYSWESTYNTLSLIVGYTVF